jgi:hypothetical protein
LTKKFVQGNHWSKKYFQFECKNFAKIFSLKIN